MFTLQVQDLVRQLRGQLPDQAINAIEGTIGNCSQPLEHRAPVRIEIDGNYIPSIFGPPRGASPGRNCQGTALAALTVVNRAGKFDGTDCKSNCVSNGLALRAVGPSQFDEVRIENLYVGSLKDLCGNPIEGVVTSPDNSVELCRFEITNETGPTASTAYAVTMTWNGSSYVSTGTTIIVSDFTPTGEFYRRWRNGYVGWCSRLQDRLNHVVGATTYQLHECIWVESKTRFVEFTLTAAMVSGSAGATVNNAWGADDRADVPTTITVSDRTGRMNGAPSGTKGVAVYDETLRQYVPLHSYYSTTIVIPGSDNLACIRITSNGQAGTSCLFEGEKVDFDMTAPVDFCLNNDWINPVSVWVFAPNYVEHAIMPVNKYHFGIKLHDAWNVGGVIKPLYMIKATPDEMVILRFEDSSRRADCVYPAQVVAFDDYEDYCNDDPGIIQDVYAYLPNSNSDATRISGVKYAWGKLIASDFNGRPLYLSLLDVRNNLCLFALITIPEQLECTDLEGTGEYLEFIKQGDHVEPWDSVGESFLFSNRFRLLAEPGNIGLVMLDQTPGKKPLLVQVEHKCVEVIVGITPTEGDPCSITLTKLRTAVPAGPEVVQPLDLEDTICGCCG